MRSIERSLNQFNEAGIRPVAISVDTSEDSRKLAESQGYTFPILSDHSADVIRRTFGPDFLIGVSTHSLEEARAARDHADFAVFGPVFTTESKNVYGAPQGIAKLAAVTHDLAPFPILALGGMRLDNLAGCQQAGASGIAGIGIFNDLESLPQTVNKIRELFKENE